MLLRTTAGKRITLVFSKLNVCFSRRKFYLGRENSVRWHREFAYRRHVSGKLRKILEIMKYIITLILFFSICSCNHPKNNGISNSFFDFDDIEHYHVKEESEMKWQMRNLKAKDEKKFHKLFMFHYPDTTTDKNFYSLVNKFYSKKELHKEKFPEINEIYTEKYHGQYDIAGCAPFYRDILIFKKDKKIIGISKICFQCNLNMTVGTKRNVERLGHNGDYEKLAKILKYEPATNSR